MVLRLRSGFHVWGSSPNGIVGSRGGGGTWFVSWCFNRAVVVLFGVVFSRFAAAGFDQTVVWVPESYKP